MIIKCACGQPHRFSDNPNQLPKNYDCAFCGDTFDAAAVKFTASPTRKNGKLNNDEVFTGSVPDEAVNTSKTTAKGGEGG